MTVGISAMSEEKFSQPELINHNNLKRMLCELFDDILEQAATLAVIAVIESSLPGDNKLVDRALDKYKQVIFKKIDDFNLGGDDS